MQLFELLAVTALLVMVGVIVRGRLAALRAWSPAAFQVVIGLAIGLYAAVVVTVLRADLVPDEIEPVALTILVGTLVIAAFVLLRQERA